MKKKKHQIECRYVHNLSGQNVVTKSIKADELYFVHPTENETILIFKTGTHYLHLRSDAVLWYRLPLDIKEPTFDDLLDGDFYA